MIAERSQALSVEQGLYIRSIFSAASTEHFKLYVFPWKNYTSSTAKVFRIYILTFRTAHKLHGMAESIESGKQRSSRST